MGVLLGPLLVVAIMPARGVAEEWRRDAVVVFISCAFLQTQTAPMMREAGKPKVRVDRRKGRRPHLLELHICNFSNEPAVFWFIRTFPRK